LVVVNPLEWGGAIGGTGVMIRLKPKLLFIAVGWDDELIID
jgi:hypothetical protein